MNSQIQKSYSPHSLFSRLIFNYWNPSARHLLAHLDLVILCAIGCGVLFPIGMWGKRYKIHLYDTIRPSHINKRKTTNSADITYHLQLHPRGDCHDLDLMARLATEPKKMRRLMEPINELFILKERNVLDRCSSHLNTWNFDFRQQFCVITALESSTNGIGVRMWLV